MNTFLCHDCQKNMLSFFGVYLTMEGKKIRICDHCYNLRLSSMADLGIDMNEVKQKSFEMKDSYGEKHFFCVKKMLTNRGIRLIAQEFIDDEIKGYNFDICGDFECDQSALEDQLYEKVKEGLAYQSIERDQSSGDTLNEKVIGCVSYDFDNDEGMPLMVIDGKEYSWQDFGKMVRVYEGWKFKLEFE